MVLFVLLPFALAAVIFPLVSWRSSVATGGQKPILTSEILATGRPGQAQILGVRPLGSIVDVKPMVRFQLRVREYGGDGEPFDLEVVQAFPRSVVRQFHPGDTVEVRLTPDRSRAAVVWDNQPPYGPG